MSSRRALTEDEHLAGWFPTTLEGDRAAGAPLHFSFRQSGGEPFDGEMLAFEPLPAWSCAGPTTSCASSSKPTGRGASSPSP